MPEWLSIALGIVGGLAVIAGAAYLAFRPYLAVEAPKAWMPEATGRANEVLTSETNSQGPGAFG